MNEQIAQLLMTKLEPYFYLIGSLVVMGIISFGGSIISLYWKSKTKSEDKLETQLEFLKQGLAAIQLSQARLEGKLDVFMEQSNKDINNLGNKLRGLDT